MLRKHAADALIVTLVVLIVMADCACRLVEEWVRDARHEAQEVTP